MVRWFTNKALSVKLDDLCSISKTHEVEGDSGVSKIVIQLSYVCTNTCTQTHFSPPPP